MTAGRRPGYQVTHGPASSVPVPVVTLTGRGFARCTCGRPFYADTAEQAGELFAAHLDRMRATGRLVVTC